MDFQAPYLYFIYINGLGFLSCTEHFDENLDNYLWSKPIVGYVLPAYVGGIFENDGVPTHLFRAFYIDVGIFETLGQRYEVQPIIDELCKIHEMIVSRGRSIR